MGREPVLIRFHRHWASLCVEQCFLGGVVLRFSGVWGTGFWGFCVVLGLKSPFGLMPCLSEL